MLEHATDSRALWGELASYARSIEVFEVMGTLLCFDSINCTFFEIDRPMATVLQSLKSGAGYENAADLLQSLREQPSIADVLADLAQLVDAGLLSNDDQLLTPPRLPHPTVATLALIMATDCNLRCKYCYADAGTYHKQKGAMDFAVGKAAVDFLIRKSRRSKEIALCFFGGEPLLNFPCIERIVRHAEEQAAQSQKECSFSVTTNGTLLTVEMARFFEQHKFGYVISLDGDERLNDSNRIFPNGSGSYGVVVKRLREIAREVPEVMQKATVRATFTGRHHDLVGSLSHLKQLGFLKASIESCSALPEHIGIDETNLPLVLASYDDAARWYLDLIRSGDDFSFFHMQQLFFQVAEGQHHISQCGAGRGYLAVSPDGEIYPCHRLVGNQRFRMGTVFGGVDPQLQHLFGTASVPYKQKCRSCWARYVCGGGCHATAIQFNQELCRPYDIECELMKHRIRLGAWLYATLAREGRQHTAPSCTSRCTTNVPDQAPNLPTAHTSSTDPVTSRAASRRTRP
jgi:uncharacterized protein